MVGMRSPLVSCLIAVCFCGASPASAATLVNGSFENLSASFVLGPGDRMAGATADGWSILSESPDWLLGAPGPSGRWFTPWGDFFTVGAAEGAGYREGVSQTITGMTVGTFYRIEFQQANGLLFDQGSYLGVGNTGGWEVRIDGTPILTSASLNDNSTPTLPFPGGTDWNLGSVLFQATATSQDLEFLAYGGSAVNPTFQFLDSVIITESQIPEPGPMVLALLALGGFLVRRRRA